MHWFNEAATIKSNAVWYTDSTRFYFRVYWKGFHYRGLSYHRILLIKGKSDTNELAKFISVCGNCLWCYWIHCCQSFLLDLWNSLWCYNPLFFQRQIRCWGEGQSNNSSWADEGILWEVQEEIIIKINYIILMEIFM